jgi:hypothetical protein
VNRFAWEPRSLPSRTQSLYIFAVPASVFQPARQQLDRHPFKPRCPPPVAIPLQFRTYLPSPDTYFTLRFLFRVPTSISPLASLFSTGQSTRSTLEPSRSLGPLPRYGAVRRETSLHKGTFRRGSRFTTHVCFLPLSFRTICLST